MVCDMHLIDTHCHLTHGRLRGRLGEIMERAGHAGVVAIVCASGSISESKASCDLAETSGNIYFTAGVHPHEAKNAAEGYQQVLRELAGKARCAAVGEIGLDYHYNFSPPEVQRRVFAEQLALGRDLGKPIVIHTREAFEDTLAILRESGADAGRIVFHSFTLGPAEARRVLDLGATISFSGIATFKKADDIRQSAALCPDDRILIETDGPYLSPEPVRSMKDNEPANVAHVAARLAAVRGTSPEAFADLTIANAVRFFHLSQP